MQKYLNYFVLGENPTGFFYAILSTNPQIMELTGLEPQQIPHSENQVKKNPCHDIWDPQNQEYMEKWSFVILMKRNLFEQQSLTGTDINKYNIQLYLHLQLKFLQKFRIFQKPPASREVTESIPSGFGSGSFFQATFQILQTKFLIILPSNFSNISSNFGVNF